MTRRTALRAIGIAVAALVGLNLALGALDRAAGTPGGPTSSSFATGPDGLAAYADLVARSGHPVVRLREHPDGEQLDPDATLVVLDPDGLTASDGRSLRSFLRRGGRLVAGGVAPGAWLDELLDAPPAWDPGGARTAVPIAPVPELRAVGRVRAASLGSWADAGQALPVLAGAEGGSLLAVARVGRGRVLLLADASPLQNRLLASEDNAALGLGLAGPAGRPVHFAESVHGYGRASGLAAVPFRWRWALGGLVLAALLWILARGRRLGPPERTARPLPPARQLYVESVGSLLQRTRDPAAAEPVRAAARARLAARTGVDPDDAEGLRRAGARLGLGAAELDAVLAGGRGSDELVAAGRALARLEAGTLRAAGARSEET